VGFFFFNLACLENTLKKDRENTPWVFLPYVTNTTIDIRLSIIVKRAGTYAARVPQQELHKIAVQWALKPRAAHQFRRFWKLKIRWHCSGPKILRGPKFYLCGLSVLGLYKSFTDTWNVEIGAEALLFPKKGIHKWNFRCSVAAGPQEIYSRVHECGDKADKGVWLSMSKSQQSWVDPSILWHSGIWGEADEAVLNKVK
jgi:hypothetical protein